MFVEKMPIHHRIKRTIKSSYAQAYREFDGFGVIEIKINIPPTICLNDGHRECVMTAWKINYIWIVLRHIWSIYTIVIFMWCVISKFLNDVPSINLGKKPFFYMIKANVGYLIAYQKFGIKSFESAAYRMLCARSLFRSKRHMLALNVDKAHRYHIHRYSGMISYDFCCMCRFSAI